jgi:pimeloyl-ACP methyl ester carboxylesterase
MKLVSTLFLLSLLAACDVTGGPRPADPPDAGATDDWPIADTIAYRTLDAHAGCSQASMSYAPASVADYGCAAKQYSFPAGVTEDTGAPIVILVHGNSDTPAGFERFPEDGIDQLAERLPAAGLRTYAIDLRIDLVDEPQGNNETENAARNVDHGWSVPLLERFYQSVLAANPGRRVTLIGFSLGATVIRDALRRLHLAGAQPFDRLEDVVLLAGANHGVSSCALCGANPTMRGEVTCQMGCRDNFSPTPFLKALNGPGGAYETPCADGDRAFGETDACGGNPVAYTTVVMRDIDNGTYQDLFVSESSARLAGADNRLIALEDVDESGYFFDGLFKNHYGAARSQAALDIILDKVTD